MYISMLAHSLQVSETLFIFSLFASQPVIIIGASSCLLVPSFAHSNLHSNPSRFSFFLTVQITCLVVFEM